MKLDLNSLTKALVKTMTNITKNIPTDGNSYGNFDPNSLSTRIDEEISKTFEHYNKLVDEKTPNKIISDSTGEEIENEEETEAEKEGK